MTQAWKHEYSLPLPVTAVRLYRALTDQSELEQWFAEHARVTLEPGGDYRFWGKHTIGTPAEGEATGRIISLVPERELKFIWTPFGVRSEVTITLTPADGTTTVSIEHHLDGPIDQPRPKELIDDWWRLSLGNLMVHTTGHGKVMRPDFSDPNPQVRLSIVIDAKPEKVFGALIEPEQLNKWLAKDATIEPRVGGRFDLGWKTDPDIGHEGEAMEILELVPNEKLTISWPDWRGDTSVPAQSVTWQLEPEGNGTRVTLTHTGFTRAVDVSDYPFGWGHFLSEMAKVAA